MATDTIGSTNDADNPLVVEDDDTYISSAQTFPGFASLPPIDDGSGTTVAVGTEIRFEATGGSVIVILDADGRRVGTVPGYGAAVVVAEQGADESSPDFWRFSLLANSPAANIADPAETAAGNNAAIDSILDVLEDFGMVKAE